ncbi:LisH domain-containing protein ARMC9 isoform X2 [Oopsacas minuta]|uniref:LisH domain-containing protein ARMC9 isoform X2 n=1 Tax=Oopsacas minuta TaxID=111878 RepID=A0AAV7K346_9METZ|nr:LisH domain-containing protein ARMC9 isoform X2 [Oopsacas minuta]
MSDISGSVRNARPPASEVELLSLVCEYFFLRGFPQSLGGLESEMKNKGITMNKTPGRKSTIYQDAILHKSFTLNSLVDSFDRGDRDEFLHLWNNNVSTAARESKLGLRLEFQSNLHFAVIPIRLNHATDSKEVIQAKEVFKEYLNERSSQLALEDDMFPFYALPYLKEVRSHPSFQDLFRPSWLQSLRADMETFLQENIQISTEPQLVKIYQGYTGNDSILSEGGDNNREEIEQMRSEYKREQVSYIKRYKSLQESYQTLIDLAMQLVEALEDSLHGRPISEEYISSMCRRLFGVSAKSVPSQDSNSGASLLRASIASHSDRLDAGISQNIPLYPSLDLQRVKSDLCTLEGREIPLLLQALRTRLTHSLPGEQRDAVLNAYIREDILGIRLDSQTCLLPLLYADSVTKEALSRLLNALGSLAPGRTYLAMNWDLLKAVFKAVQLERDDTPTRQNLTGVMQKLSLRRAPQSIMINMGVVSWLSRLLESSESLSEYSLHYTLALLMNLSLRSKGRASCVPHCPRLLVQLSRFLQLESAELRSYANGVLYSILSIGKVRDDAVSMGLQELLECVRKSSSNEIRRQIEFVLQQLESPAATSTLDTESDDEEDEEDTDDPTEPIEGDLEDFLRPSSHELHGEELLCHKYLYASNYTQRQELIRPTSKRNQVSFLSDNPLSRPITPRSFAHKQNNPISFPVESSKPRPSASDSTLVKSKQKAGATSARRPHSANKQTHSRSTQPPKSQSDPSIGADKGVGASLTGDKSMNQSSSSTPENLRKSVIRSNQLSTSISLNNSLSPGSKFDPQPSVKAIKKLDGQISREVMHEYKEVFVSRPRITRTPEPDEDSSPEQSDVTRSTTINMATDSLGSGPYAPIIDKSPNDESNIPKDTIPNVMLEFDVSPPKTIQSTRTTKQNESRAVKPNVTNQQNARNVVTRARSKAKQAK